MRPLTCCSCDAASDPSRGGMLVSRLVPCLAVADFLVRIEFGGMSRYVPRCERHSNNAVTKVPVDASSRDLLDIQDVLSS